MRQEIVIRTDDLDGETPADETVTFRYEGVDYEIDLTIEHANELREILRPYIEAASRVVDSRPRSARRVSGHSREELKAIREWAREAGFQIGDKGRVSQQILDAYAAR